MYAWVFQFKLLQGSSLLKKMEDHEDPEIELPSMTKEHYNSLAKPFFEKWPQAECKTKEDIRDAHTHATSLVSAYSFILGDDEIPAMVPFWDMLNHQSPENASVRLSHSEESGTLSMIAVRDIAKGDEIFNTYGPLGNSELLRRYGFVEENNPHNSVTIFVDDVLEVVAEEIVEGASGQSSTEKEQEKARLIDVLLELLTAETCESWELQASSERPPCWLVDTIVTSLEKIAETDDKYKGRFAVIVDGVAGEGCCKSSDGHCIEKPSKKRRVSKADHPQREISLKQVFRRLCKKRIDAYFLPCDFHDVEDYASPTTLARHHLHLAIAAVRSEQDALKRLLDY